MISKLKAFFTELATQTDPEVKQSSIELCCFSLMCIIANIDNDFDENERITIKELGKELFSLDDATISDIIKDAEQSAHDSTSLHQFTSTIHEHLQEKDKFALIVGLWKIAYADGSIDKYEEHIIRRVAELVYLDHARFTEAKHVAKP